MSLRTTHHHWGSLAMVLHWGMAVLILGLILLGWVAEMWHLSPTKLKLFFWHKSLGILVLALALIRIGWRLIDRAPAPPPGSSRLEQWLARVVHGALYLLMLAMPLSGWVIHSAANFPLKVFGFFPLPAIVAPDKAVQQIAQAVHLGLFWLLAALLLVHVGAAWFHHQVRHDGVLRRMLPQRATSSGEQT